MPSRSPIDDIAAAAANPQDAPNMVRTGAPDAGDAYDEGLFDLSSDCPVKPLGFLKHQNFFLDWAGQLITMGTEFRKGECMMLFGTKLKWLKHRWPVRKEVLNKATGEKEWTIVGFDQKEAQEGLIQACAKQGIFDPTGKVRGRGAHRGDDGELILHCGDQVLIGGQRNTRGQVKKTAWAKSGLIGGYVYPTAPRLAHPANDPAGAHIGAEVLDLLQSWNWKRKGIDPHLMLCWIATALLGGALPNRPHGWITGPSGAGKSTLQRLIRALMDDWGVFTEDATEAGVRQLLDQDTLAVLFDEIEPDESNSEVHMKIVKLARLAYSGGSGLRGGVDHKSKQFVARSCFLFSSIHHHELPAQDRNRVAILHLSKFPPKTVPIALKTATLKDWGAQLRRRLVEQWHRFDETLETYQREMLAQGYTGREQDTYGTLLACGDLLLHDHAPNDEADFLNDDVPRCADLVRQLAMVLDASRAEAEDTTERCLKYLASHRLPAKGGQEQETVGRWIAKAYVEVIAKFPDSRPARAKLLTHGLALVNLNKATTAQGGVVDAYLPSNVYLAVANKTNKGVAEIFAGSMWERGIWGQSLQLTEGAVVNKKKRFAGPAESCVLVPLSEVIDIEAAQDEAREIATERPGPGAR